MIKYRRFILVSCLFFFSVFLFAQDGEIVIIPDRTGGTAGPAKLDHAMINLELGANFSTIKDKGVEKLNAQSYAGTLRYGLLEQLEVNLSLAYNRLFGAGIDNISGFGPMSTGVKIGVADEKGALPQIEFEGILSLSFFGSEDFRPKDVEPFFNFNFANTLSNQTYLNYGLGMFWEGGEEATYYGFAICHNFTPRLTTFIEHYGSVRGDINPEPHFGAGLMYLVNNEMQLDFSIDLGRDDGASLFFFDMGVATMLKSGK